MTNYEKYKEIIDEIWEAGHSVAICNGEVRCCDDVRCIECGFSGCGYCAPPMARWLVSEYKEPLTDWSKVAVDTPILVRDNEDCGWRKRHFAEYKNGKVYAWCDGHTSWTAYSKCETTKWKIAKLAEGAEGVYQQGRTDAIDEIVDKIIYPLLDEYDIGLWENIDYIPLAEKWVEAINYDYCEPKDYLKGWIAEQLKEQIGE